MTKVLELLLKYLGGPLAKLLLGKLYSWLKKKIALRKEEAKIKRYVIKLKESKSNEEIIAALRNLMP